MVNFLCVKCVRWLTELQHNVVSQVRKQIYRSHTAVEEPYSYGHGADMLCDVGHSQAGVAIYMFFVLNGYRNLVLRSAVKLRKV